MKVTFKSSESIEIPQEIEGLINFIMVEKPKYETITKNLIHMLEEECIPISFIEKIDEHIKKESKIIRKAWAMITYYLTHEEKKRN